MGDIEEAFRGGLYSGIMLLTGRLPAILALPSFAMAFSLP